MVPPQLDGTRVQVSAGQVRTINTATMLVADDVVILPDPTLDGWFDAWADIRKARTPRRP
jgi:hypothetical protein